MNFKPADTMRDAIEWTYRLYPADAVIHVGVGEGAGILAVWRERMAKHVLLIDAAVTPQSEMQGLGLLQENLHIRQTLLSDKNGMESFHVASNPAESGLLPVAVLTQLWPNLRERERIERDARRLDDVLAEPGFEAMRKAQHQWLIVECLPALKILRGAATLLERVSVVAVKTLLRPLSPESQDCMLAAIEDYLIPQGFKLIEIAETNHPALGEALFVRDVSMLRVAADLQERERLMETVREQQDLVDLLTQENTLLAAVRDDFHRKEHEHQERTNALLQERDHYAAETAQRQDRIETLESELDDNTKKMKVLMQAREKLIQAQEGVIQKLEELMQERETWSAEKDELIDAATRMEELVSERQTRIDTLIAERDEQGRHATTLRRQLEQAQAQCNEKDRYLRRLESELAERDGRQRQLDEEMIRAEAQIELIKDILLREPGL